EKEVGALNNPLPFIQNELGKTDKNQKMSSDSSTSNDAPEKSSKSKASLFRWAMLLTRIFEILPLCCPKCNHPMRIISFIEDPHTIRKILTHINEPIHPPPITPARAP